MIVAGIGIRYFPLNKLIKLPGSGQIGLMNKNETGFTVPHTLLFDFEVDSASANPEKLYKGIAHSGRFSAKAFGSNSYTVPLERKAGDIGPAATTTTTQPAKPAVQASKKVESRQEPLAWERLRGGAVKFYEGVPYTGPVVKYQKNGLKEFEGNMFRGKKSGSWNLYDKKGNIKSTKYY